jgi:hypothetical protein
MKTLLSFCVFVAASFAVVAQNKEIESIADIRSVTIYNSAAEINGFKEISLPAGESTVIFTDLTPFIVRNTINMSAPGVDIITITEKINYIRERKTENTRITALKKDISSLETEIGLQKCKSDALAAERELLFRGEAIGGLAKGVQVSEIEKASAFFSRRYYDLTREMFTLGENEKLQKEKLEMLKNQLKELTANTSRAGSEIRVKVISPSPKNVGFSFKFLTARSGWAPVYDCKYEGAGKPLKFIFRVNVFNATGVDWENIDIRLSTASPTEGFDSPSLKEKKPDTTKAKPVSDDEIKFMQIEVSNTIAEYDIKHKYTIPSDSKPYLVDVASYEMNASYYYLLIPKLDAFGFLMAKIPDWNKYNLIPGITNIYNKGSFMGKTFLNTYAENDTLGIYLGKDNNIQSSKKEVVKSSGENIIGNYDTEESEISISLRNVSAETYSISLLDQVPAIDRNSKTKLNIDNADQALYDSVEGLLTWNFTLAGGESKNIDYSYKLKVPENESTGQHYRLRAKRYRTISAPRF